MENQKEYPKYRNQVLFVYIVIAMIAVFIGQTIFESAPALFKNRIWGYALGCIAGGYIINVMIYELGKIIFGKFAKFHLVASDMIFLSFKRNNKGKVKGKFNLSFAGHTIMAPSSSDAKNKLYLLGGGILTFIFNIALIVAGILLAEHLEIEEIKYCSFMVAAVGLFIMILNLSPFLSDEINDGFTLRLIANEESKKAFHHNLLQEEVLLTGKGELSPLLLDEYHNHIKAKTLIYNYYYYIDNGLTKEARDIVNLILEYKDYLLEEDHIKAYANKLFFDLLTCENEEKISEEYYAYEKEIRKGASNHTNFETIKSALLVAVLIDSSYDFYEYLTTKIDKKKDLYKYELRKDKEDQLIEKALTRIQEKKPDWFKPYEEE